jgi:hypothetical protein
VIVLDDVDYLVEKLLLLILLISFNVLIYISCHPNHGILPHPMHRLHVYLCNCIIQEQTGTDPQELQAHEVPEEEEQGEDLSECADHQPSSFEEASPEAL